jgi:hypothetical protein
MNRELVSLKEFVRGITHLKTRNKSISVDESFHKKIIHPNVVGRTFLMNDNREIQSATSKTLLICNYARGRIHNPSLGFELDPGSISVIDIRVTATVIECC